MYIHACASTCIYVHMTVREVVDTLSEEACHGIHVTDTHIEYTCIRVSSIYIYIINWYTHIINWQNIHTCNICMHMCIHVCTHTCIYEYMTVREVVETLSEEAYDVLQGYAPHTPRFSLHLSPPSSLTSSLVSLASAHHSLSLSRPRRHSHPHTLTPTHTHTHVLSVSLFLSCSDSLALSPANTRAHMLA